MITYGSVCSGIEAATVAWHPLGWQAAWLAEIEPFPSAVLAHHYPQIPNLGDMTTIADRILAGDVDAPDILTGGTPCQAFSVAGLRKGLDDARGQLSLTFCRLADAIDAVRSAREQQPCVLVWENVPGVLSDKGNAFGCFLAGLAGENDPLVPPGGKWSNAGAVFGPARTVAWRVLDAQYFGVAQRRRRVWVVASARKGFDPAAILFESEGVRRDTAPGREAGEGTSRGTAAGAGVSSGEDIARCMHTREGVNYDAAHAAVVAFHANAQADQLPTASRDTCISDTLTVDQSAAVAFGITDDETVMCECLPTLTTPSASGGGHPPAVAFGGDVAGTLNARYDSSPCADRGADVVATAMQVRRLTPVECERLQGFPDNYTRIPWRNKPSDQCPDGPRYKALGNSWAVPCAAWIGRRINDKIGGVK